jgi:hypothetical protein
LGAVVLGAPVKVASIAVEG